MTSTAVEVMNTVSAAWVAATPPTRTTVSYHELDEREIDQVTTADRGFMWRPTNRESPVAIMPDGTASVVEYVLTADLFIMHSGYGRAGYVDALTNEGNLLCRIVERQAFSLPSNCLFLDSEELGEPIVLDDDSGALIPIRIRTRVAETD